MGHLLSTWGIGGYMWGGQDESEALAAIQASIDLGITSIDTAPLYGLGHSEKVIGKAIAGKRDQVQILTKYGLRWDRPEGAVRLQTMDMQGKPITIRKNSVKNCVVECMSAV